METKLAFLNASKLKLPEIQRLISQCKISKYELKYCKYDDKKFYIAFFQNQLDAQKVYETYDGLEFEDTGLCLDLRYVNHDKYEYIDNENDDYNMEDMIERAFDSDLDLDEDLACALIDISDENIEETKHIEDKKVVSANKSEEEREPESDSIVEPIDAESNTTDADQSIDNEDKKGNSAKENKPQSSWKDRKKRKIELRQKEKAETEYTPDLQDERFAAVYDNNDYNIDLTHYAYKANANLKDLVREKRRRRNK